MDIQTTLDEIGFSPARFAAMLNVEEARVLDWLAGRESPPAAVFEVLRHLLEIKQLSQYVHCSVER